MNKMEETTERGEIGYEKLVEEGRALMQCGAEL